MRRRFAIRHYCREGARWLLVAALIYSPWDYGGTTEQGIRNTTYVLTLAVGLWILRLIARAVTRRRGTDAAQSGREKRFTWKPPLVLVLPTLLLLALGWWMAANAKSIYDSDQNIFVPVAALVRAMPGSIDQALSTAWMWRATTLLGTAFLVADAVCDQRWLLRIWTAIAASGTSIAFLGLIEKASGARMIFWQPVNSPVETFFATFFYHGNAGAFLNLTLPLTIGLAVRSLRRPRERIRRALWLTASIVSLVATFANTSRMGQFLGAGIAVLIGVRLLTVVTRNARRLQWTTISAGVLALCFALYGVIGASQIDRSARRWEKLGQQVSRDARWAASRVALKSLPDAGWSGFGPGTFDVIFPYYTAGASEPIPGRWRFLHQDYLQTAMEWGWLGAALWAWIFFGALIVAMRNLSRASGRNFEHRENVLASEGQALEWSPRQRLLLPLVLLGLLSVALHALVDFPLQVASIQLYVATYVGICWGSGGWGRGRRKENLKTVV